jgi:PBP1b-binding outer membrane lipoprotein LpoB
MVLLAGCATGTQVTRVDAGSQTDLSGRWNDTDVRTVCETLITGCLNSARVDAYVQEFRRSHGGRLPVVIVGDFTNASSEHIDTGIIARQMEIAIVNSGKLEFVAGGDTREALRSERQDQLGWANEDTAASLANETGANLMLTGSVRAIVDRADGRQVRSYFVSAELTNVETSGRLWMGEDSSIKKEISRAAHRL